MGRFPFTVSLSHKLFGRHTHTHTQFLSQAPTAALESLRMLRSCYWIWALKRIQNPLRKTRRRIRSWDITCFLVKSVECSDCTFPWCFIFWCKNLSCRAACFHSESPVGGVNHGWINRSRTREETHNLGYTRTSLSILWEQHNYPWNDLVASEVPKSAMTRRGEKGGASQSPTAFWETVRWKFNHIFKHVNIGILVL